MAIASDAQPQDKPARRVLILKPSALGDIVMALPVAHQIKTALPGARISWLVSKPLAGILDGSPDIDEVIEFDRKTLGRLYAPAGWQALNSLRTRLKEAEFDAVLDLQGLFRTAILGWLSGCRVRIGMMDARECAPLFYTSKVAMPDSGEHVVDFHSELVRELGIDASQPVFRLGRSERADHAALRLLQGSGVCGGYAVIVAAASDPAKQWPATNFAQVADRLARLGLAIVATGSAAESPVIESVARAARTKIINLAGRTNIPELVSVIRGSRVVVGNDTGPTHIAAALGLPMAVIFGTVNPARLYPYGRRECVAAIEPWTRPAGIRSRDARYAADNVTVQMVWDIVTQQMKDSGRQQQ